MTTFEIVTATGRHLDAAWPIMFACQFVMWVGLLGRANW